MVLQCFTLGCLDRVGNSSTLPILNGWNWTCLNHHVKWSHDETITGLVQGKLKSVQETDWLLLNGLRAIPKKSSMMRVLRFISTRAGTSDMSYIYITIYIYISIYLYIYVYIYVYIYRSYISPMSPRSRNPSGTNPVGTEVTCSRPLPRNRLPSSEPSRVFSATKGGPQWLPIKDGLGNPELNGGWVHG
jgi:hypothetical protein